MRKKISRLQSFLYIVPAVCMMLAFFHPAPPAPAALKISANARFFATQNGEPFFWLGDTGWLLFSKLNREETETYLENRRQKGFTVIQVMVLHGTADVNAYGDTATLRHNVGQPHVTPGSNFSDAAQYDFWDHIDWVVSKAAEKGLYMAMVPVWGGNVKAGNVNQQQAKAYASFLAQRYRSKPNVIWMNGGDIKGTDSMNVWNTIGNTLHQQDPGHLITFHPFGRMQSSIWFHNQPWLYFNMVQSGHRRYSQDSVDLAYGEDNWKYIQTDYAKKPVKPVLDGEPSYENIPQGLHDTTQPRWKADDVRRYGYWSVFAGACGYTYGDNAVMQMRKKGEKGGAYGAKDFWFDAIDDPGAGQMVYLKKLMLSRPYFDRVPDQSLIAGDQGSRYEFILATRGANYAFIYTYTGRSFGVNMGKIAGSTVKASWYNPRNGTISPIGMRPNQGIQQFDPPGGPQDGNDWVLILDKA